MKTNYGIETIDEISTEDYPTRKEFLKELSRLCHEYRTIGMLVYSSQRCDKTWNDK